MTDPTVAPTPPSSPAPAAPSPSPAAPAAIVAPTPALTPSPTPSTPTAPSPATRPDWLPEAFFDATAGPKWDDFGKHFSEVVTRDAAEQVRRLALPQKAEDYQVGTTPAFNPPEGVDFKLNDGDPLWPQARSWAHKWGLPQEAFAEGIDLIAGSKVGDAATTKAAHDAEIAKLGTNGPARVTALGTFFDGMGAGEMKAMLVTAGIVQAAEKFAAKFISQGAASFSQAHRVPGEGGGKVSDEEFARMGPAARLDYARRFDQSQFQKSA